MTLKRESILAAIASTLAGTTQVSSRIYRSRVEAFSRTEAPALLIEPRDDTTSDPPVSNCNIDCFLHWKLDGFGTS
jgi:hypothetical protein